MIKNITTITFSSYLAMLFLGVAAGLIGAAARNIGLTAFDIGLMISSQNLGFILSVLVTGSLADTHPKPRLLLFGSLILAAAFLTFYITPIFGLNLFIMFLVGVGIGSYEGVTDALLIDIHPLKSNLYININHFFVTFGSILITLYLIFLQMNWRNSVVQSGLVVLLLAGLFALIKPPENKSQVEPYLTRMKVLTRDKVIVVLFLVTALVVGVEAGTIGILTTYLMEAREFTQVTSKIALILFLVGMATGRIVMGYITPQDKIPQFLLVLLSASTLVFSALFFLELGVFTYALIFLAGLSMSALLPLILSQAGILYEEMAGTVLGTIKVAIPLGGIVLPFLISSLVRFTSFEISLMLFPLSFLTALVMIYATMFFRTGVRPSPIDEN